MATSRGKPCILVAARKVAFQALAPILDPCATLVHAETLGKALSELQRKDVDLVLATADFDDSRMFDLFRTIKAKYSGMPFIGCRALDSELNKISTEGVRIASEVLGAAAFLDLPSLAEGLQGEEFGEQVCTTVLSHLPAAD
jgi:hypothetical protein